MNIISYDILNILAKEPYINQRILASISGKSVGAVNNSLKELENDGYLDSDMKPTLKAKREIYARSPHNAIILAAGVGMRMVPINIQTPKALLEINGEVMIERTIRQLHDVGIYEIYVVVGFMKEMFEYLIDKFGVRLIINPEYAEKNNLHSMQLVADYIGNTYVIPCDIWCESNPYNKNELYSWYMVSDLVDDESFVRVNRKKELVSIDADHAGNSMIGISYLVGKEAQIVKNRVNELDKIKRYEKSFWEETLFDGDRMIVYAKVVPSTDFVEINTYEQLRELDDKSNNLRSDALETISGVFNVRQKDIENISVLKKGMTNRSFLFSCRHQRYVMRIPGEGTEKLINRNSEADAYKAIAGKGICDDPVYMNPDSGYKITKFLNDARTCNPNNENDLKRCMALLKKFHDMNLKVNNTFDIFERIVFYESLWNGTNSIYRDYQTTKRNVFSLKSFIENHRDKWCLTHIDAVYDNFLFYKDNGKTGLQLTDWEYAGMQDPDVDLAMFSIYAFYNKEQVDHLIDIYFDGKCKQEERVKIYCFVAVCGLLWSNWCEYKRKLGVEFGEYSIAQYRYAKDFYKIVQEELK